MLDLLRIRHDLQHGQETLTTLDFASVDEQGGLPSVAAAAAADLHRAADRASTSPWLSAVAHLPVLGRQVRAMRDLTSAADHVGQLGQATANEIQVALDQAGTAGPGGRVQLIDTLSNAADRLEQDLGAVDVRANGWLLPPLDSARRDLVHHLSSAGSRLEDGRATLATLRGFLDGPRRYLILGGNNAEMRSMGIATTSGLATIQNGSVEVGDFVLNAATAIEKPGVPVPDGWDWLYGYLDPGSAYANMLASPNFPLTGETAAALSARNKYGPVDGVIYVDTIALQGVLEVVGPVTVDGVTYDGENAARLLVNENYFRFANPDQSERRDAQGRVARAIFDAVNTRHVSLVKLAAQLQSLALSRHMAAWSSLPAEQKLWHDVGADGERSASDLLVASQDLGASKLDYYVSEKVAMDVHADNGNRRVDLSISLTNPDREPRSAYIDGGSIFANPGEYGFYLVVNMPHDAFDVVHDDPSWTSAAEDGPFAVTTFTGRVPIGTTRTVHLSFLLPPEDTTLNVIPSGRIAAAQWDWRSVHFDDTFPSALDIGLVSARPDGPLPGWLLSGLLLFGIGAALTGNAWGQPTAGQRKIDANLGWWLVATGIAMAAVQITIYITAP